MRAADHGLEHITPAEVCGLLRRGQRVRLIDVREPLEHRIANVEGAELIPLGSLPGAVASLERDDDIVVMCHHGVRSQMACEFLRDNGFTKVRNLTGGIDRWSVDVDPRVPRY